MLLDQLKKFMKSPPVQRNLMNTLIGRWRNLRIRQKFWFQAVSVGREPLHAYPAEPSLPLASPLSRRRICVRLATFVVALFNRNLTTSSG